MTLPASGSDQPWEGNLWCTPGTKTYVFFNMGEMIPPPYQWRDYKGALHQARDQVKDHLMNNQDGSIPDKGYWSTQPAGTNIKISVINAKGQLTYGILGSALTGLSQFIDVGYNHDRNPIVFQVNDGAWGEVGIGYVGMVDPTDASCTYSQGGGKRWDCADVIAGKVIE
ncbi:MAG: hypothetical protein HETSPECPRED_005933 [Heterodermia speciosa]|uniref:Uncharacterized protein n=1 Tax=Heterodermia speciosa TaxID=116794 RepID=A0A8H3FJN2_9LECA|nr:MAG: hypothetical protein HETSPECPRED_005933 [Heterodermia speciosa]